MIGSSNLTSQALSQNHEWNLKVSAAAGVTWHIRSNGCSKSSSKAPNLSPQEWIDAYAALYVAPPRRGPIPALPAPSTVRSSYDPNEMQQDALLALDLARAEGASRAIIVSATGTGKTILSALDVRAAAPKRLLFVVHREQILDRTIEEYRRVLGGPTSTSAS